MSEETNTMLALYEEPVSDQRSLSSSNSESPPCLSLESSTTPYIGQRFATHEVAYEFYTHFAKRVGFSIRRHRTDGKDGVGRGLMRRYFVCHRAGNTPSKQPSPKKQRNRKSSRCGCQAYLRITKSSDASVLEWRITGFSNHHNHELLEPDQVRFLPAYRVISEPDKNRILMFAKTGISVQQMMKLLELEKCLQPGNLPFTEKDVRNLIQSFKKSDQEIELGDDLLKTCKSLKERDPNFRFDFTVDCRNGLENIAWSYNSSVQLYEIFGDVVVFDTSHSLENFGGLILGIWVGMNNHGTICFFGCVLFKEENLRSFSWALQVFLSFMNGKWPRTILTDQNPCLKEAIQNEMPNSKHAFCIWSIITKLPLWFNEILKDRYFEFKMEFCRLYNSESTEEFETGWQEMVENYELPTNRQILNLFAFRSFWALPYLKSYFFAGFHQPNSSKLINALIQRFLSAKSRLGLFFEQIAMEMNCKDESIENQISLKTGAPMEAHAALHLTPYAFSKLQDELVIAANYAAFQTDESSFLVRHHTKDPTGEGHIVTWAPQHELLSCSCRLFESTGILCRHVLRVLSTSNCFQIPEHYLPVRWRRDHASVVPLEVEEEEYSEKIKGLRLMMCDVANEAVKSKERMEFVSREIRGLLVKIRGEEEEEEDIIVCKKDKSCVLGIN